MFLYKLCYTIKTVLLIKKVYFVIKTVSTPNLIVSTPNKETITPNLSFSTFKKETSTFGLGVGVLKKRVSTPKLGVLTLFLGVHTK